MWTPTTGPSTWRDELDEALGAEDLGLAVAAEVVLVRRDVAVLLAGLGLGEADARDLGVAVGDAGDAGLVDGGRREAGDLLGDEDALGEAAVGELEAGHDVADGVDARRRWCAGARRSGRSRGRR